jgi:hypothetical protein
MSSYLSILGKLCYLEDCRERVIISRGTRQLMDILKYAGKSPLLGRLVKSLCARRPSHPIAALIPLMAMPSGLRLGELIAGRK